MPRKKPAPYEMRVVTAFTNTPFPNPDSLPSPTEGAQLIPLTQITPSPHQPRRYFDPETLAQLTASVKAKGVLEPLLVRPLVSGGYELMAGERRLRAAAAAGLEQVPCMIYNLSDQEAAEIALLENLQREDLNPVEETEGILDLLSMKLQRSREEVIAYFSAAAHPERPVQAEHLNSMEWQEICAVFDLIGRFTPNSFRTNRLPLLKLPNEIRIAISQGQLDYSKARLLGRIQDQAIRAELLQVAVTEGLTREELQRQIHVLQAASAEQPKVAAEVEVVDRLTAVYRKAKKPRLWNNTRKRKKLERLLTEMEKLLEAE